MNKKHVQSYKKNGIKSWEKKTISTKQDDGLFFESSDQKNIGKRYLFYLYFFMWKNVKNLDWWK